MQAVAKKDFNVIESEWIHFGDAREDADSGQKDAAGVQVIKGWLIGMDMVRANTITVTKVGEEDGIDEECITFKLVDCFMPQLLATKEELTHLLRVGVYVHTSPDRETAFLARLCVFMNRQAVLRTWSMTGSIPCFGDVFRLLTFYRVSAPPSCSYAGSAVGCYTECVAWMQVRDCSVSTPVVFRGMPVAHLFRVESTPIVIDTATHAVKDIYEAGAVGLSSIPCPGGVIVGAAGTGKFSSFFNTGMQTGRQATALSSPRTHCRNATLFIVPAGGLAWRLTQARLQHPGAAIVKISTACDLKRVCWQQLMDAEYIFTTFQFISTPKYLRHFNKVVYALASGPILQEVDGTAERTRKRRRVNAEESAAAEADAEEAADEDEFDIGIRASKASPSRIEEEAAFACNCARRLLHTTPVQWETFTTPVLEILTYNRVVFLDCDKQRTHPRRLQHFLGASKWVTATTAPPVSDLAVIVLPPAVVSIQNAIVKHNLVELCMTFVLTLGDPSATRVVHHTRLPMTPREILTHVHELGSKALAACNEGVVKNLRFVKTAEMQTGVLAAAKERMETITTERNTLRENLEKAEADQAEAIANGTVDVTATATAEINYEYWGDIRIVGFGNPNNTSDIDGDYEYFEDDDDDDDEDDDEDEDEDDDDEEDDDGEVFVEEIMLETTPARIKEKIQSLTAQIEDFERDGDALQARVSRAITDVINVETCIICSVAKSNAMPPCGHAFCSTCLSTWCETKGKCPACSKTFKCIVATEECEDVPSPVSSQAALWKRVWCAPQDLSSLLFWFLCTLRGVEDTGRRAVIVVASSLAGRGLRMALSAEGVMISHFVGSLASRLRALEAFKSGFTHVIVQAADVLAGAGFTEARDVLFGDDVDFEPVTPRVTAEQRDALLTRFKLCRAVHTYTRVRSHTDA